nr:(deoxy)nucleoside triphosphate pyrophosphohydrolase [Tessaracoccus massiliensis]
MGAVIVSGGLVLAAQRGEGRALPGLWEFPGGKVEDGETQEQSLRREIHEELGCVVEVGERSVRTEHSYPFGLAELTAYWCTLLEGELVATEHAALLLARRVRATFTAARANAERIGMQYLPEQYRDRAGTALKAARLATDKGAAASERETALRRAVEILDELALYFLPTGTDARKAITGRAPLALPGRRSS